MSRLVVVSNRLPLPRAHGAVQEPEVPLGGLATAVLAVLRRRASGLWFGWSGSVAEPPDAGRLTHRSARHIDFVGLPLTKAELQDYYLGYCNQTLWPLFHSFQERMKIRLRQEISYARVQQRFAAALLPLLRPDDLVWVHDYHMLYLGSELRRLGWQGRIGFFLHIPFPPHELWQLLPDPRRALQSLLDYDQVGFHVHGFLDNYLYCCAREFGGRRNGDLLSAAGRTQRVGVYPVGIDPAEFLPSRRELATEKPPQAFGRMPRGRRVLLGVDRLDYTKGIPEKLAGFEMLLRRYPEWQRRAVLVQVASPSRAEVPEYARQRLRIEALLGRVNGEMGEHDWTPIRYLYREYSRSVLARFYREAAVGLVTPLRDGMNLVAMEYVAAQDASDPGVLVLSRCAGAAQEMPEAIVVNPFISADLAQGMARALAMSLEERRDRHAALLERVLTTTAAAWGRRFVEDLETVDRAPARALATPLQLNPGLAPTGPA